MTSTVRLTVMVFPGTQTLPLFAAQAKPAAPDPKHAALEALVNAIAAINPDDMSPRQALEALYALKAKLPEATVEVLTPDFLGVEEEALHTVLAERPEVFNHNTETVPRLYRQVRLRLLRYLLFRRRQL